MCARLHDSSRWSCGQPVHMILRFPLVGVPVRHPEAWLILALWLAEIVGWDSRKFAPNHFLGDLLMLDLVVTRLECGEHDTVLSVLHAGVHQVFNQADL